MTRPLLPAAKACSPSNRHILRLVTAFFLWAALFFFEPLKGQDAQKPSPSKNSVFLSAQEWKAVEGTFQSTQNAEMYVQFSASGSELVAKLLWNNNEIHLAPQSALEFLSGQDGEHESVHITFQKDSSGAINQVQVKDNGLWKRVRNYQPVEKKEMTLTPEQLKPFEGLYRLKNEEVRYIQFSVRDNLLVLKQHWDGNQIAFVPDTDSTFFGKEARRFTLSFSKDLQGNITQVVVFRRDRWTKVSKYSPRPDAFKALEGKYQFKDDPDNVIEVTAKGNQIIVKQLWDHKEFAVDPLDENYFYNEAQSFPFQVVKDANGRVMKVLLLGSDEFIPLKH